MKLCLSWPNFRGFSRRSVNSNQMSEFEVGHVFKYETYMDRLENLDIQI